MRAILKAGQLLLPHDAGCGAEVITTSDPRYAALLGDAVRDEDLNGTLDEDAELAARWAAREHRRTA